MFSYKFVLQKNSENWRRDRKTKLQTGAADSQYGKLKPSVLTTAPLAEGFVREESTTASLLAVTLFASSEMVCLRVASGKWQ